jgi:hypothetical protein
MRALFRRLNSCAISFPHLYASLTLIEHTKRAYIPTCNVASTSSHNEYLLAKLNKNGGKKLEGVSSFLISVFYIGVRAGL